jgi:hypothetical protein
VFYKLVGERDKQKIVHGPSHYSTNFLIKITDDYFMCNHQWSNVDRELIYTVIKINPGDVIVMEKPFEIFDLTAADKLAALDAGRIVKKILFDKQLGEL